MSAHSHSVTDAPVVHVVEDDESSGLATARVMRAAGLAVRMYQSASRFMDQPPTGPGCIILDLNLPGPSGLELQERLTEVEDALPIVFLTGHGNIPKTAHAMKAGAVDFLTKPVEAPVLLEAVSRALARDAADRVVRERCRQARARYGRLTPREREVLSHVISGQLNKQIAFDLGTSEHTIKVHRHNVMGKLEAASLPDLVRLAEELGIAPTGNPR
jgi:FixJ family two-component response regulator